MPTIAPTITAIPDFPSLADRTTYNAKAFAWANALDNVTAPELTALGTNIYNNAVEGAASAVTATNKAGEASTSAATATTQAGTATTQASASSVSAAASEASRIAASKLNLGSKSADPTLDNQGGALLTGALYFNTVSNGSRIYNGASWQSAAGVVSPDFTILRENQTATASQTVFSLVNSYIVGTNAIMVYINGVRQFADAYVETNSTTITFTGPLALGDSVLFEAGVTAVGTNVAAGNVTFSPAGGVAATNAQAAIAELGARVVAGKGANTFTAAQDFATGTAIASAATVNLDTATGNRLHITGTTTITAITLTRGPRTVIFDGILTLTHNATNNNLPGAANITTSAGDRAIYESDGAVVYCVSYIKASGVAVVAPGAGDSEIVLHSGNGHGSTNTRVRRFTTTLSSVGAAITYADSATLGATFTINETGIYALHYADSYGAYSAFGASINSAQLTTGLPSITAANRLMQANTFSNTSFASVSRTVRLIAGDIVRPHTDGVNNGSDPTNMFAIRKVGV